MRSNSMVSRRQALPAGKNSWAAVLGLAVVLAGCGGGGGSDGPGVNPDTPPPGNSPSQLEVLVGGTGGPGNVDGVGVQARFDAPQGVALDSELNLYVSDSGNATIRKVTLRGVVTTLAGQAGEEGRVDGQGAAARFTRPTAMARDAAGNLFVMDGGGSIRRVSLAGAVSTVAQATFGDWRSLAVDAAGRFYGVQRDVTCGPVAQVPCTVTEQVKRATVGATPTDVTVENVPGLMPVTAVGGLTNAKFWFAVANDAAGRVTVARLAANGAEGFLDFFLADAGGAFSAPNLPDASRRLTGLCNGCDAGSTWTLSAAFEGEDAFRALLTTGGTSGAPLATTLVRLPRNGTSPIEKSTSFNASSADGAFESSGFRGATHIAADSLRRLYIADTGNHTLRGISAQGDARTIAGEAPDTTVLDSVRASLSIPSQTVLPLCEVVVAANGADVYTRFCGWLVTPARSGMVLGQRWLHRVTGPSTVETYSLGIGRDSNRLRFGVDAANDIYADGRRYGRDGVEKANYNNPSEGFDATGAAVSPQGGVFLYDPRQLRYLAPGAANAVVRGGQSLVSINLTDAAADAAGDLYVLDSGTLASGQGTLVKKVSPGGEVTVLAGRADAQGAQDGPGATATFRGAQGVAVDRRGNAYVADTGNHTVRKVTPAGVVSTLVGVPGQRGTGLGALPGRLNSPTSVAIDANDVLYIATPGAILKVKLPQ